jgi:hypothetical protein
MLNPLFLSNSMNTRKPDFYISSTEHAGEWAHVRSAWIEDRVHGPYHDQYARIRVDPVVPVESESGEELDTLIIAPHHVGTTLFPLSGPVVPVYIYVPITQDGRQSARIQGEDVRLEAWGEAYTTRRAADEAGRGE